MRIVSRLYYWSMELEWGREGRIEKGEGRREKGKGRRVKDEEGEGEEKVGKLTPRDSLIHCELQLPDMDYL